MPAALLTSQTPAESVLEAGDRIMGLLEQARQEAGCGGIPESVLARLMDAVESLRSRLVHKVERDPRSLFDIDERLVDLLERAEEAAEVGEISQELLQEMNDYLDAFRTKVDRIAGYWRWQESIAEICSQESDRLSARKRAAERRVSRLKDMLLAFMISRGFKKLEGQKAAIGLQANGTPSVVIDDPLQVGESFFEKSLRFTKTELQKTILQLADGGLRRRLEAALAADGWEINTSAVRFAITNSSPISGARLVKGNHVRLR
jgi:DNA repair ATPase RecN